MTDSQPTISGYLSDEAKTPESPADANASLRNKQATLRIKYDTGRGERIAGDLQNRILTVGQRWKVDLARAEMCGGVAVEALSARAYSLMYAVCWLKESLIGPPSWAQNLADSVDEGLVGAIWEQVSRHEDCFFGRDKPSGAGQG